MQVVNFEVGLDVCVGQINGLTGCMSYRLGALALEVILIKLKLRVV